MARLVLVLAVIGLTVYAVIDCAKSDESEVRGLPKPLWLLVIVLLAPLGGVLWLLLGRAPTPGSGGGGSRPRTVAPDDDPDFLNSLDTDTRDKGPVKKDED